MKVLFRCRRACFALRISHLALLSIAIVLSASPSLDAKTIILDLRDCDRAAAIDEAAPRFSWAMQPMGDGNYSTREVDLVPNRRLLLRFALDKIPAKHRIVHAALIVPVIYRHGPEPRFYLWRMLADWGPGVCYQYRMTRPKKIEWTKPGAAGNSTDRATRPTDIVRIKTKERGDYKEFTVNVTEDVSLWYSGAATNNGWMFSVEDPGVTVRMYSPLANEVRAAWKLRITYEPIPEEKP